MSGFSEACERNESYWGVSIMTRAPASKTCFEKMKMNDTHKFEQRLRGVAEHEQEPRNDDGERHEGCQCVCRLKIGRHTQIMITHATVSSSASTLATTDLTSCSRGYRLSLMPLWRVCVQTKLETGDECLAFPVNPLHGPTRISRFVMSPSESWSKRAKAPAYWVNAT